MSIGLKGNSDGSGAIQVGGSDAITITTGLAATFANNVTVTGTLSANGVTGSVYPIVSSTAVASTSGTSIDFTSIPSWVKRITVMFSGVSTSGTSNLLIQLGDSGGIEITGYLGTTINQTGSNTLQFTSGFALTPATAASDVQSGNCYITNVTGNVWSETSTIAGTAAQTLRSSAGTKELSATLDRVRITTVNGTDTFDAGSINILYE